MLNTLQSVPQMIVQTRTQNIQLQHTITLWICCFFLFANISSAYAIHYFFYYV